MLKLVYWGSGFKGRRFLKSSKQVVLRDISNPLELSPSKTTLPADLFTSPVPVVGVTLVGFLDVSALGLCDQNRDHNSDIPLHPKPYTLNSTP